MTEMAEGIAMAAIDKGDGPCWFCDEEPTGDLANMEDGDPEHIDGEDNPENNEKNKSSTLGENLGGYPSWQITCPHTEETVDVIPGAHHCIPGNASLKKAEGLLEFMRKDGPYSHVSDIGYDVNNSSNGVWLPGNYGVRKGKGPYMKKWSEMKTISRFQDEYAFRAMETAGVQFHDAHPDYSDRVLDTLEKIAGKLENNGKCPICNDKLEKQRPPYGLVGRLNYVSGQYRRLLTGRPDQLDKKAVRRGYYTSSRVLSAI